MDDHEHPDVEQMNTPIGGDTESRQIVSRCDAVMIGEPSHDRGGECGHSKHQPFEWGSSWGKPRQNLSGSSIGGGGGGVDAVNDLLDLGFLDRDVADLGDCAGRGEGVGRGH